MADSIPPPPPPPLTPSVPSSNRTLMIVLSYLWLLALVPLIVEKDDREVQWHAKHGLVLTAAELVFWVVFNIITSMLGVVGCFIALIGPLIGIGIIVVHIMCILKGTNGQRMIIPGISEFANRF